MILAAGNQALQLHPNVYSRERIESQVAQLNVQVVGIRTYKKRAKAYRFIPRYFRYSQRGLEYRDHLFGEIIASVRDRSVTPMLNAEKMMNVAASIETLPPR